MDNFEFEIKFRIEGIMVNFNVYLLCIGKLMRIWNIVRQRNQVDGHKTTRTKDFSDKRLPGHKTTTI